MKTAPLLLLGCLLISASLLSAQPQYVNYQGTLHDADGNPLATGNYTMEFSFFPDLLGAGEPSWGPFLFDGSLDPGHSERVHVANGRFNLILGPIDTMGRPIQAAFTGDACYVEIRVDGGEPLLPRQQILTVPYAFESENARMLNHVPPVQYLNSPGMVVPFAGPAENVPAGWLLCDGSEILTTDQPALFAAVGTAWGGRDEIIGEDEVLRYFNLPDLRGMFLRGVSGDREDGWQDTETRELGSAQAGSIPTHNHLWATTTGGDDYHRQLSSWTTAEADIPVTVIDPEVKGDVGAVGDGGDDDSMRIIPGEAEIFTSPHSTLIRSGETRPNNAAVNFIIKL